MIVPGNAPTGSDTSKERLSAPRWLGVHCQKIAPFGIVGLSV